jgi:hypothetical protein
MTDKETRSIPLQVKMEPGQVWFPAGAEWFAPISFVASVNRRLIALSMSLMR